MTKEERPCPPPSPASRHPVTGRNSPSLPSRGDRTNLFRYQTLRLTLDPDQCPTGRVRHDGGCSICLDRTLMHDSHPLASAALSMVPSPVLARMVALLTRIMRRRHPRLVENFSRLD